MGIRVNAQTLKEQLELTGLQEFLKLPYHQAIINNEAPLSIGGGIGQSRTYMYLLKKAHLGEISVSVIGPKNPQRDVQEEKHTRD